MRNAFRASAAVLATVLLAPLPASIGAAQQPEANYDESKVPKYTLPDPLVTAGGERVTSVQAWHRRRRPEILQLFETFVYGRSPGRPNGMAFEQTSIENKALGGKAVRKQVSVYFTGKKDGPAMDLLIYLPRATNRPVPLFVGLNFKIGRAHV